MVADIDDGSIVLQRRAVTDDDITPAAHEAAIFDGQRAGVAIAHRHRIGVPEGCWPPITAVPGELTPMRTWLLFRLASLTNNSPSPAAPMSMAVLPVMIVPAFDTLSCASVGVRG